MLKPTTAAALLLAATAFAQTGRTASVTQQYHADPAAMLQSKDPMALAVYVVYSAGTFPGTPAMADKLLASEQHLEDIFQQLGKARVLDVARALAGVPKGFTGRYVNDPNALTNPKAVGCQAADVRECFWELLKTPAPAWSRDLARDPIATTAPATVRGGGPAGRGAWRIAEAYETLKGQTRMSVNVLVNDKESDASQEWEARIAARLKNLGITVDPHSDPLTYPALVLEIDFLQSRRGDQFAYTSELRFKQLLPVNVPGGGPAYYVATTWRNSSYGIGGDIGVRDMIDEDVTKLPTTFIDAYQKANPR
jgi:hypothetical protein